MSLEVLNIWLLSFENDTEVTPLVCACSNLLKH